MSNTSIGRGPAHGGNENHDGDPLHTTLGEAAPADEPPVGNDLVDPAAPQGPVPGGRAQGRQSSPDGPDGEDSARERDAAPGKLPPGSRDPCAKG